jgi:3-deoxy-D-manno-octulosonic-acid transferase
MGWLLDLAYLVAGVVLSPRLLYQLVKGDRATLAMRCGARLGEPLEGSIWLHGSSVGEVSVLKPLVALLERDLPSTPLVISAFTKTGIAAARKHFPRHRVVPLPFDLSFVVRRVLAHFDPRLVIIAESEFWPNFIAAANARGAAVAVVNGKMSAKSYRSHARFGVVARALRNVDMLAAQTEEHAARLRALGVAAERIAVTGNMKYDLTAAPPDASEGRALRRALGYLDDDVVIIGGSLHEREDEALLDAHREALRVNERAALIIVPRYPDAARSVEEHALARGLTPVRKSAVDQGSAPPPGGRCVLVVDTLGELGRLYAVADIAFVGGSLYFRGANKGGHNLMEPAILAVPVLFGPHNFSFKETVDDLRAADAGRQVNDAAELAVAVTELVADAELRRELGLRAQRVVRRGQGATARNYSLLRKLLDDPGQRLQALRFDRKMSRAANDLDSTL